MLQGDQSNAPLFIAGCGLATLAIALTQGWRHKALVGSLFLISIALGACAMTWGYFEAGQPQIAGTVSAVAGRSASWFALLVFSFGIISILDLEVESGGLGVIGAVAEKAQQRRRSVGHAHCDALTSKAAVR